MSETAQRFIDKRFFTVEEANAEIPQLEAWLEELRRLRRQMESVADEMAPILANAHLNTGGRVASQFLVALHQFNRLVSLIHEAGIILRDLETGLVDFPALHMEREVYLCWKSGESTVEHWHETDTGYAGRRRLNELGDETFDFKKPSEDDSE